MRHPLTCRRRGGYVETIVRLPTGQALVVTHCRECAGNDLDSTVPDGTVAGQPDATTSNDSQTAVPDGELVAACAPCNLEVGEPEQVDPSPRPRTDWSLIVDAQNYLKIGEARTGPLSGVSLPENPQPLPVSERNGS